jgi:peptidoglycan hydrolase-like protein with peptidoglycan-binding domain
MLSIVSLKLINLNLEVETLVAKTEEDLRKQAELKKLAEKLERPKKLLAIFNKLESLNFFQSGGLVYKVGSNRMNSEIVKLINNYLILYKYIDISKWNDSNYDSKTAEAVLSFQNESQLIYLDGKIGNETRGRMKSQALKDLDRKGVKTTDLDPFSPLLYKI